MSMSIEEFVEQVWHVERLLIKVNGRKKSQQVRPYPYQKRLPGTKRRDDLLSNRIQPCLGKAPVVIVDSEGATISKNYTLQKIRGWYDVEKLDQAFDNVELERLNEELKKMDSSRLKEIMEERRTAASSELQMYKKLFSYAQQTGKYEHLLKQFLGGIVSDDKIPEIINKLETHLLLDKIRTCVQAINSRI